MAVGGTLVLTGFLTPVLTQLFFPKPLTTRMPQQRLETKIRRKESLPQPGIELTTTRS